MKKIYLVLVVVLAFIIPVMADNGNEKKSVKEESENVVAATYSLQGTVYDPACKETISGATITIEGKKYYSDLSGNFIVPVLDKSKYTVSVDFVSYRNETFEVDLSKTQNLEIRLSQQ